MIRYRIGINWHSTCLGLVFGLVVVYGMLVQAQTSQEPIEVVSKKDDLEEIQLKSRLEDRLARDIQAYLGHSRFIVNVDVSLQRIRQVIKETKPPAPNNGYVPPDTRFPKLLFPEQAEDFEEDVESLPGLPYVNIPSDKEKEAEIQFMREQIKRLQREQRQPKWGNGENGEGAVSEKTVGVFNKIKQLLVTLVVESDVSAEQEVFLRNLVYQKASLNDLRGDELKIIKTEFSALPDAMVASMEDQSEGPMSWMDQYFNEIALGLLSFLALLLLILILMGLRKKKEDIQPPVTQQKEHIETSNAVPDKAQEESEPEDEKEKLQKTRQDIISLGLGQPQQVQKVMDDLVQQPEKVPLVASIYKIMGRSLFRSLFPNVQQEGLQSIMAHLADQPPDEEQLNQDLFDFHQLLQSTISDSHVSDTHPFEFLNNLNDSQVLYLIQHEDERIQALVISQLSAEQGAKVLNRIPIKKQTLVMSELGQFETFPVDTFKDVADRLAKAAQNVPSFENVNADGLKMLISMLDNMSSGEEAQVLKRLRQDKPDTFHKLRKHYFTFGDLLRTPRQIVSNALREVERSVIGRSLCHTPDDFKIHVLNALPPKLKALAREDLKRSEGRISMAEVDQSRKQIVMKIREYIAMGKFSMEQLEQVAKSSKGKKAAS